MARNEVRVDMGKLLNLPDQVAAAAGAEIRLATLDLLGEGIRNAPVREGILRGSGTAHFGGRRVATAADFGAAHPLATPLTGDANTGDIDGAVVFNTAYAAAQHEGTDFVHPKGGKAKYVEDPANANRQQYIRRVQEAAARALGAL